MDAESEPPYPSGDRTGIRLPRRGILASLLSLPWLGLLPPAMRRAEAEPVAAEAIVFRRGIGVGHALAWADVEPGGAFAFPPFAGPARQFRPDQMRALRTAGLDFVRLAVDPGAFLQFEGRRRDDADRILIDTTRAILDSGLGVIVDIHPSNMHPAYFSAEITRGKEAPAFRAYLAFLTRIAAQLAVIAGKPAPGRPAARLALELYNEPELSASAWQPMLEAAYGAARKGASRLPLVLGGGLQNAPEGLMGIDTTPFEGDPAVFYTFHDYEPWQFTHQGSPGNPAFLLTDVPYPPPGADGLRGTLAATARRIRADGLGTGVAAVEGLAARGRIENYRRTGFDRRAKQALYGRIAAWAQAHGIPPQRIVLGEFGVHLTPYQETPDGAAARARWLTDTREIAEAHGFAWAAWVYIGTGGFALAEGETGPALDPAVSRALGLKGAAATR